MFWDRSSDEGPPSDRSCGSGWDMNLGVRDFPIPLLSLSLDGPFMSCRGPLFQTNFSSLYRRVIGSVSLPFTFVIWRPQ